MMIGCRQRRQAAEGAGGFFGIERMSKAASLRTMVRGFAGLRKRVLLMSTIIAAHGVTCGMRLAALPPGGLRIPMSWTGLLPGCPALRPAAFAWPPNPTLADKRPTGPQWAPF